ncbi:MAG TPA: hypothetical protein DCQ90_06435 [Erysipelotrichaceae bacterium]|nr:hypothetical protein [Erysipelotrichaceae bacterium]
MFDINSMNKRYFEVRINGRLFEVEPPKVKTLKKIVALQNNEGAESEALNELSEAVRVILSKNKEKKHVSIEVIDDLDIDQMNEIITNYFEWISGVKKDPNL